jgi:hypothetical protein
MLLSWFPPLVQTSWLVPAAVGVVAFGAGAWVLVGAIRARRTPEEIERRRRIRLHVVGRMGEATVEQADAETLHYCYEIAGVYYSTSQDIRALAEHLPAAPHLLIGNALIKYHPQNPANSILLCEHWSGLQAGRNAFQRGESKQ